MPDSDPGLMTVFADALERTDLADRAAYLDAACAGNATLRQRVEALLAAHDGAGRFLEGGATGTVEPAAAETHDGTAALASGPPPGTELLTGEPRRDGNVPTIADTLPPSCPGGFVPGEVIAGRYTLLEVLGEGGMGTVYRAEQAQPVKRQVALKLIKTGMDSRTVLARFDAERQALALMDHPNIARVFDGGATEDNQPFFVMELVHGVPITDYCDQHRLPVRARLELFVAVCQAVQHAHQKGIIHRDLKPGNILVTEVDGRPTPKVIDFGVAKATEFDLAGQSFTGTGAIVGTPAYMSPEQADPSSMDIDTRTDVYALGVILYELLTGSPPIDATPFKRGAILEMLRMVREVDPPRPSTKVSAAEALPSLAAVRGVDPAHLKRALRGDLDWIVMKALEKDRTRRYETASGFAADILRHLAHEPVVAAPPSRAYRVRKFVRKHKGGVIAACLVLLVLLAGIAGTTWGLIEARRQESEARRQERIARAEALGKEKARHAEALRAEGERRAKERAEAAEEAGRKLLYTTDMRLASFLWSADRTTAEHLRKLLAKYIPERAAAGNPDVNAPTAKPDLRGFEWYYYQHLLDHGVAVFAGHKGAVADGAFAPDGRLVTLDEKAQVRWWELGAHVEDEARRRDLVDGRSAQVAALSPDGRRAALAQGNEVHVFDTATGKEIFQIPSAAIADRRLIFARDEDWLVVVDDRIRWCNISSGAVIASLDRKFDRVESCALSADGRTLAVVHGRFWGDHVSCFRLDTIRQSVIPLAQDVDPLPGGVMLAGSALSHDGRLFAVGGAAEGSLGVSDTVTGRWIARHSYAHAAPVWAIAFSGDGAKLATADALGTIKFWADLPAITFNRVALTMKGHAGLINTLHFSSDGKQLASSGADRTARVWDLENAGRAFQPLEPRSKFQAACFSPDGLLIATVRENAVELRDATTGRVVRELAAGGASPVQSVAFSPTDHRLLAVGHAGQAGVSEVALWDIDAGRELSRLLGATDPPNYPVYAPSGAVSALAFSPDGKYLVAGFSKSDPLKVWEVASRRMIHHLDGRTGYCVALRFSRDGTLLASGNHFGAVILWSTVTWQAARTLENPDRGGMTALSFRGMQDLALAPDARTLAMASGTGNLHLWDVATGTLLETLQGHSFRAEAVEFSPDGRTLASGGGDATLRLWNVATRRELMHLDPGSVKVGMVNALAFSPDGKHLLAADWAGGGTGIWSAAPILWNDPARAAEKLRLLLQSNADFASRIRMLSENLRLHEALEKLDTHDVRVPAALAAAQANWHAARQAWPEAALAIDRLMAIRPTEPEAWLRTPGLLRLATALLHQDRPADAARLLQNGAARQNQDGLPAISGAQGVDDATGAIASSLRTALERRLADDPRNIGLLALRAELDGLTTDFARQVAECTAAIQVRTEEAETGEAPPFGLRRLHRLRGDAYVGLKQWQEAVADYDQAITPETTDADLLANRARAHEALKHHDAATADWTRAAAASPEGARWLAALARRLVAGGQGPMAASPFERAQTRYEHALAADPGNDQLAAELAQLLMDRQESDDRASWTIVKPAEMKTETGAKLELNQDGSVFAHQSQPFQDDTYSLVFSTEGKAIQCLRLEVLADSRLPQGGPGWGDNGNFLLNELRLEAAPAERPGEAKVIALRNPWADFSSGLTASGDWHVEGAVDGDDRTGWAVFPQFNQDHTAVFELAEPVADGRAWRLTVRLIHRSFQQNRNLGNLGRVRVSVGSDAAGREQKRVAARKLGNPWARLAAAYHLIGKPQAALRFIAQHPEPARGMGDLFAEKHDWEAAIAAYRRALADDPADTALMTSLATAYQAAGRTREAVPLLAAASSANPKNTLLSLKVATLQAWFGQDEALAVTRQRILALAKGTNDATTARRAVRACGIRPSSNKAEQGALLALAGTAGQVDEGKDWNLLALGIAEYRSGNAAAAAKTLLAAAEARKTTPQAGDVTGIAAFYRALCLFEMGQPEDARALASAAAAKMKPLPPDEQNPLAGGATSDDLVLWLAYKEAKAMIHFDAAPAAPSPRDAK